MHASLSNVTPNFVEFCLSFQIPNYSSFAVNPPLFCPRRSVSWSPLLPPSFPRRVRFPSDSRYCRLRAKRECWRAVEKTHWIRDGDEKLSGRREKLLPHSLSHCTVGLSELWISTARGAKIVALLHIIKWTTSSYYLDIFCLLCH